MYACTQAQSNPYDRPESTALNLVLELPPQLFLAYMLKHTCKKDQLRRRRKVSREVREVRTPEHERPTERKERGV